MQFKKSGKWYQNFDLDMSEDYNMESPAAALAHSIERIGFSLDEWIYVCSEPYHKFVYPVILGCN